MAVLKTLLHATLAALAIAGSSSFSTHVVPLSSLNSTLNTTSPVKNFKAPLFDSSALTYRPHHRAKRRTLLSRQDRPGICLEARHGIIADDCSGLCANIGEQQGAIVLAPFELWYMEQGHCVFELINLSPCNTIYWDPISTLSLYCTTMSIECATFGWDGFLELSDQPLAMALAGLEAAPPYTAEPC